MFYTKLKQNLSLLSPQVCISCCTCFVPPVVHVLSLLQGYWGCAIGKAKQAAKTEIEKLQMNDLTCRELVKEVAKIIYIVHDEVKDKAFELELSWVGDVTNGRHELVPKDVREEAEKYAKDSLEEEDDSDEDNM
uniref:Proteasome 20S subunit alpha 3 n=1 Tax=Neogobius melanostomus TaxID=47308 RepID=A0A8C6SWL0_9GOBI